MLAPLGCGGPPLEPLTLPPVDGGPVCGAPHGTYAATFTLRETHGDCSAAKPVSHDPMQFDAAGHYRSPLASLIECETVQSGCRIAVRCTSDAIQNARADLDATLDPEATTLTGTGIVTGSYAGCQEVVYDVVAIREE
ncbi:MAG: hypothetical protein IRZ16_20370 [Myxococcaceae bacterium]|nr:hypothetical protein [Myxococcaceae bacterium]